METALRKMIEKTTGRYNEQNKVGALLKKITAIFYDSLSIIIFIGIWEIAPRVGWVPQTFISPPTIIVSTLWELLVSGILVKHIGVSLGRAILGFVCAAVIAIPLGFFLGGWFKLFERILTPVLRLLGEVNPFSLFPSLSSCLVLVRYLRYQ